MGTSKILKDNVNNPNIKLRGMFATRDINKGETAFCVRLERLKNNQVDVNGSEEDRLVFKGNDRYLMVENDGEPPVNTSEMLATSINSCQNLKHNGSPVRGNIDWCYAKWDGVDYMLYKASRGIAVGEELFANYEVCTSCEGEQEPEEQPGPDAKRQKISSKSGVSCLLKI